MSMWDRLNSASANNSPKIIIYGPPGIGKTTLASEFPNPIFLQTEDGIPSGIFVDSFGFLKSYEEVLDAIRCLWTEKHDYKTLVLDSLDKLEILLWAYVCKEEDFKSIQGAPYAKGYGAVDIRWKELLDGLDFLRSKIGMTIVAICHSSTEKFDDPSSESYNQYDLNLNKKARPYISAQFDAILLMKQDVQLKEKQSGFVKRSIAEGSNRVIFCEGRPSFIAKNRYGMPYKINYKKGKGYEDISKYLPVKILSKTVEIDEPTAVESIEESIEGESNG